MTVSDWMKGSYKGELTVWSKSIAHVELAHSAPEHKGIWIRCRGKRSRMRSLM